MRTGRDEAAGVVRGWIDARALLRVELRVESVAVALRVRPVAATDEEWRFAGDDGVTGCAVRLGPTCTFDFRDIRYLPTDPQNFEEMVTVYFSDRQEPDADHVTCAVITEP